MSVRAYKLIEVRHAESPTFSLSHDERITNLGVEDNNVFTIQKEEVERELQAVAREIKEKRPAEDEELEYLKKCLEQIILDCGDEDYCEYYCF